MLSKTIKQELYTRKWEFLKANKTNSKYTKAWKDELMRRIKVKQNWTDRYLDNHKLI